ncbi:cAMP-dependent protein kinase regulatory chain domain containing protein [Babesia gibsoni]|uniref:cAMP-dependent protein kinase regulatory chain domain containing protein n=1 Tax=Babesia gibsoni TaxID=33632 RepID=A0AAD8LMN0_BABGI|nr:cAMP-dependent protein kinase regulatory chain domain containing protein [Babesia gibsoni]
MTTANKCSCLAELAQLHTTVREELHPCKEEIYETRISQLQGEINKLQLKNDDLRGQLADMNSIIASDPFISSKFQSFAKRMSDGDSHVYHTDASPNVDNADVYRQIRLLSDRNRELECRLSSEQAVSMSWKHKVHDLEKKINYHLDELIDLTKSVACVKDTNYKQIRLERREGLTSDTANLLKLAQVRIESDKTRIETLTSRISELERQLLESRLNTSEATNYTKQYIHISHSTGASPGHTQATPSAQLVTGDPPYKDDITRERDIMMEQLGIPKGGIIKEVPKTQGCNFSDKIATPVAAPPPPTKGKSERRKLIGLYSDILKLLKRNKQAVQTPKFPAEITASPTSPKKSQDNVKKAESGKSEKKSGSASVSFFSEKKKGKHEKMFDKLESLHEECMPKVHSKDDKIASNQQDSVTKHVEEATHDTGTIAAYEASIRRDSTADEIYDAPQTLISSDSIGPICYSGSFNSDMRDEPSVVREASLQAADTRSLSQGVESGENTPSPLRPETCERVPSSHLSVSDNASSLHSDRDSVALDNNTLSYRSEEATALSTPSGESRDVNGSKTSSVATPTGNVPGSKHVSDESRRSSIASKTHSSLDEGDEISISGDDGSVKHLESLPLDEGNSVKHMASNGTTVDRDDDLQSQTLTDERHPSISTGSLQSDRSSKVESTGNSLTTDSMTEGQSERSESPSIKDPVEASPDGTFSSRSDMVTVMSEQKRQMLSDMLLLLEGTPVLKDLSIERLRRLLPYFKSQSFAPKAAIIIAGEKPQNFYVLASGMVSAYSYEGPDKDNRLLRRYMNTDYFGEQSLINNTTCSTYIIAESHVTVQAMSGKDFVDQLSDLFPKFTQRAKEEYAYNVANTASDTSQYDKDKAMNAFDDLRSFMAKVPIVSKIPDLDVVSSKLLYKNFSNKEIVIGNMKSMKTFHIVYRGSLSVHLDDDVYQNFSDFAVLGPKTFFGGFKFSNPKVEKFMSCASLVATGSGVVLTLHPAAFNEHMKETVNHLREYMEQFFLDKLQEHDLVQDVKELSARTSDESSTGRASKSLESSVLDSDEVKSENTVSPHGSSKSSLQELSSVDSKSITNFESESNLSDSRDTFTSPSVVNDVVDSDRDSSGPKSISSMSSSFGDSDDAIGSDLTETESSVQLTNEALDSFRTESSYDIPDSDRKSNSSNDGRENRAPDSQERVESSSPESDTSPAAPPVVIRRGNRRQTGIYRHPLNLTEHTDLSDEKSEHTDTTGGLSSIEHALQSDESISPHSYEQGGALDSDDSLSTFSDDSDSVTSKTYDDETIQSSKELLIATLKSKCTSLAAAFNFMDPDNCGVVFRSRFYEAMDELSIASIETGEFALLFELFKEPDREVITMASLYRNSGETVKNASDLCLRLKHVYGSALAAFEKQFGSLRRSSTCAEADFAIMVSHVGVSVEEAGEIYKELDVCQNGYVTIMTMLKLMRGDWTREEAIEKEQAAASGYNQLMGYLQQEDHHEFRKEFSNAYMCIYDILEYGTNVAIVDSTLEEMKFSTKLHKGTKRYMNTLIMPAIESHEYYKTLSVLQRKYVASLMAETKHASDAVIISQGDTEYNLYMLLKGNVKSSYSNYVYSDLGLTDVAEGSWLSLETFVTSEPSGYTYKVGEGEAVLGCINREAFMETVVPMVEIREKRVPVLSSFLKKVSCFEKLEQDNIDRLARTAVVRKYKMHETIFKVRDFVEWFYIVFDGCVVVKAPRSKDQAGVSVETTGFLGAEDVCKQAKTYHSTALANTPVVYLLGWPVPECYEIFGDLIGAVSDAASLDTINRDHMRKQVQTESLAAPPKNKKCVSFSIKKDEH